MIIDKGKCVNFEKKSERGAGNRRLYLMLNYLYTVETVRKALKKGKGAVCDLGV